MGKPERANEREHTSQCFGSLDATRFTAKSLNQKRKGLDTMARIPYKIFDYVIRRFNAPSGRAEKRTEPSLRHRLARSPDSNWNPESPEARRPFKAPREDWFLVPRGFGAVDPNRNRFMKFVTLRTERTHQRGEIT
jgi:hypothetical protein